MTYDWIVKMTCRLFAVAALALGLLGGPLSAQTAPATPPSADAPSDSSTVAVVLSSRPTVALSGVAEWEEGLKSIQASFDRIRAEMGRAGLQPGGRPIAVFTETDDKGFHYDAMIPLAAEPAAPPALGQGVRIAASPGGRTMKFEHRGAYDDIDSTYEAITAYLDEKGLEAQNLFIEEYLNSPKGSDDQDLELDIYVFLR